MCRTAWPASSTVTPIAVTPGSWPPAAGRMSMLVPSSGKVAPSAETELGSQPSCSRQPDIADSRSLTATRITSKLRNATVVCVMAPALLQHAPDVLHLETEQPEERPVPADVGRVRLFALLADRVQVLAAHPHGINRSPPRGADRAGHRARRDQLVHG